MRGLATKLVCICGLAACGAGGSLAADPIVTFSFTDLESDFGFDGEIGFLNTTASAIAAGGPFNSTGDVTRVLPPPGTATFGTGFVGLGGLANFVMSQQITNIDPNSADGVGSFAIIDPQGDIISGTLVGTWENLGLFAAFSGLLSNVTFINTSLDGTFDGPTAGNFGMTFPGGPLYDGSIMSLITGSWFSAPFEDANTLVQGSIVPEPASALLLLAVALLRRR